MVTFWFLALWAGSAFHVDQFSTKEGLIHQQVIALDRHPQSPLWIGTSAGACQFDGLRFNHLDHIRGLPATPIMAIHSISATQAWMVTQTSVYLVDDNRCTLYLDTGPAQISVSARVNSQLWVGTDEAIWRIAGKQQTHFTRSDGLPDAIPNVVAAAPDGHIWVGYRLGGLARYDGESWRTYARAEGLDGLTVNDLAFDDQGRTWAATHRGVYIYDSDRFSAAPFHHEVKRGIVLELQIVGRDEVWLRMVRGPLFHISGRSIETVGQDSDRFVALFADHSQRIWALTSSAIYTTQASQLDEVTRFDQPTAVHGMMADPEGCIWVATGDGMVRVEPKRLKTHLSDPTTQARAQGSSMQTLIQGPNGHLWMPSLKGLGHYRKGSFQLLNTSHGLPSTAVHAVVHESEDEVWVGTEGGLAYGNSAGFSAVKFGAEPISVRQVWRAPSGDVYVMDERATVWRRWANGDRSDFEKLMHIQGFQGMSMDQQGRLWCRTTGALIEVSGDRVIAFSDIPADHLHGSLVTRTGAIFFATELGIFQSKDQGFDLIYQPSTVHPGLPTHLREGRNSIWMAFLEPAPTYPAKRIALGLGRWSAGQMDYFDRDSGLLSNWFDEIIEGPSGSDWVVHPQGVTFFEGDEAEHLTVPLGLTGNRVNDVVQARNGTLWIATNGGLNCYRDGSLSRLTSLDGLLDDEILDLATDERTNEIWIRSRGGVQTYQPLDSPPELKLLSTSVNGEPKKLSELIGLNHKDNDLTIDVQGIHMLRGADQMRFKVQLSQPDDTWSTTLKDHRIQLPELRPGSYRLQIDCLNRDLVAASNPIVIDVQILPPIWRQTWFVVFAIIFTGVAIYVGGRLILRAQLEQARILNELATANRMQMGLMPAGPPKGCQLDLNGVCLPAREVGGDFYDYFWFDDNRQKLGLAIIDVCGKSMEAAMISVMASGLIAVESGSQLTPKSLMGRLNKALYAKTSKKRFVTGIIACLDLETRVLTWCNAGHEDPIILRQQNNIAEGARSGEKRDLALGVVPNWDYHQYEFPLMPNDTLILFTDGVTEASNEQHQLYGAERMLAAIAAGSIHNTRQMVSNVLESVAHFCGHEPQSDDITLIAMRVD